MPWSKTEYHSIQFAGAVGISNCPGAPALNAFIGMYLD